MKKTLLRRVVTLIVTLSLLGGMSASWAAAASNGAHGRSTELSGSRSIWIPASYPDVDPSHWFYAGLQKYRILGIVQGDEAGFANLDAIISAAEIYALFVRYVYSDSYEGQLMDGAIQGDYMYNGHYAWLDAYDTVHAKLAATIELMHQPIDLPNGQSTIITRDCAFVLYAMAALSRAADPVWYLNQFSDTHLGYYARSNAPITTYEDGHLVLEYFKGEDHWDLSPLQIQCANMLMYLGVLNGAPDGAGGRTLNANGILTRAEGIKLLVTLDQMDTSPHVAETGNGSSGDWGGGNNEYPDPPDIPELPRKPVTITFADWDNNILGGIEVMTNTDIRQLVSDYVQDNLIHPDLRAADPNSLTREDNYRGIYSIPAVADEDERSYPLTSHLDYVFVKRPLVAAREADTYIQQYNDGKYPYAYGWALCNNKTYENTWTTLGVGELSSWDGSSVTYEKGQESWDFALADLEAGIPTSALSNAVVILKAIYQPGPDLVTGKNALYRVTGLDCGTEYVANFYLSTTRAKEFGENHPVDPDKFITRRSDPITSATLAEAEDTEASWTGVNKLQTVVWVTYERNAVVNGRVCGVERGRQLSVSIWGLVDRNWLFSEGGTTVDGEVIDRADLLQNNGNYTHEALMDPEQPTIHFDVPYEATTSSARGAYGVLTSRGKVLELKNEDVIEARVLVPGNINKVNLCLMDKYNSNAFIGKEKSHDNEWYRVNDSQYWVADNFNYKEPSSNLTDNYYDCGYDDCFGTNGRLISSMLNGLSSHVMNHVRSDYGVNSAFEYWSYSIFDRTTLISWDAMNMRDGTGEHMFGARGLNSGRITIAGETMSYIKALIMGIEDVVRDHYREAGWWNFERDEPQLSYHQLQLWLIDCQAYSDGKTKEEPRIKSPTEADTIPISWCRLHVICQQQ